MHLINICVCTHSLLLDDDCGVFTILGIECMLRGHRNFINMDHMALARKKLALRLIRQDDSISDTPHNAGQNGNLCFHVHVFLTFSATPFSHSQSLLLTANRDASLSDYTSTNSKRKCVDLTNDDHDLPDPKSPRTKPISPRQLKDALDYANTHNSSTQNNGLPPLVGLENLDLSRCLLEPNANTHNRSTQNTGPPPLVGLRNLGLTCYINVSLQRMFSNPAMRENVEKEHDLGKIKGNLRQGLNVAGKAFLLPQKVVDSAGKISSDDLAEGFMLLRRSLDHLIEMRSRDPVDLNHLLRKLKIVRDTENSADEFWTFFIGAYLEYFDLDHLCRIKMTTRVQGIVDPAQWGKECPTSSKLCEEDRINISHLVGLDDGGLCKALETYFATENMQRWKPYSDNKSHPYCNLEINAIKFIDLTSSELPDSLSISLERLVPTPSGNYQKNTIRVEFPLQLDMGVYCTGPYRRGDASIHYEIRFITIHSGGHGFRSPGEASI